MQDGQNTNKTTASNRLWLIISLVAAATLVAVLMVPEAENRVEDIPPPAAGGETGDAMEEQARAPLEDTEPAADVGGENDGDAARKYLADMRGEAVKPDALFARAQEFQSRGKLADAWLLYFKAAKEGHAGAAMVLAEQADPRFFQAQASALSRPDVVQARKWYLQAQRSGNAQAGRRLAQLLTDLEKSARAGDEQAAVLLEKWK
ncbi:hypothetical protein [Thiolapillus sp.]